MTKRTWKHTKTQLEKFDSLLSKPDRSGCVSWLGGSFINGRPIVAVGKGTKTTLVARVVLERKLGRPLKAKMLACHSCDNAWCCSEEHVWEGTYQDNVNDMVAKGRQAVGVKQGHAKLTEAKVRQIKYSIIPDRALAKKHGVARSLINRIKQGKSWGHIT